MIGTCIVLSQQAFLASRNCSTSLIRTPLSDCWDSGVLLLRIGKRSLATVCRSDACCAVLPRSWLSGSSDEEGSISEGRVPSPPSSEGGGTSLLDTVLLAEWEDRAEQGLFRYDVTACPTKVVPGAYGFLAQFNEGRGSKKRPTEFCVDRVRTCNALMLILAFSVHLSQKCVLPQFWV